MPEEKSRKPNNSPKHDPLVSGLHFRGKLPHLKKAGATYFVTFRLADSLPASRIVRLKQEREAILEHARAGNAPLSWHDEQNLLAWYCDKVEELLDAGHGACWLNKPEVAALVSGAIKVFENQRYRLHAWVVMPNHAHVVFWPFEGETVSKILHSWKSYTGKEAIKLLPRRPDAFWQDESFDHWIRDDDERARLVRYVENNPTKARLCHCPEEWKWSSAHKA